ncbi:MAG TPA: alpha/beta fold hydrolase [Gammaproteobacteria bacterium]|nr:alpha/beta fold hydrolase [Gammaproteobacteria bacterium]
MTAKPGNYRAGEAPVVIEPPGRHDASVIWLHGLGADGHDFEGIVPELGLPRHHGIRFTFPHAPKRPITINGGMVMRGWYDIAAPDLTLREDEAGLRDAAAIVEEFIATERAAGVAADRIVLAGFSQGGAVALFTGLRHFERLAGIMALSTYLPLPGSLSAEAHDANRQTPIFMGHGLYDPLIPVFHGRHSAELLRAGGHDVTWRTYAMPHSVCAEEVRELALWLKAELR